MDDGIIAPAFSPVRRLSAEAPSRAFRFGFRLRPGTVLAALSVTLALLLMAHGLSLLLEFGFGYSWAYGFVPLFNIGLEGNVPTFFASFLLLGNGLMFAGVSRLERPGGRSRRVWLILGVVFAFLAVDEFAGIHELFIEPVRAALGAGGYLYFAWVIPYAALVLLLALLCAPVLWRLEDRLRGLFALAAVLYLSGAVGVEMLGGRYFESVNESADLRYRLFQTAEESLEFAGLIVLSYTLLTLVVARTKEIHIDVDCREQAERPD